MKIALCLSGQPRFVDKSHENIIANLITGYDVDVFCHSWVDENNAYRFKNDGVNPRWENRFQDPKTKQNIIDWFKPRRYMFETPRLFAPPKINGVPAQEFFMPMYLAHHDSGRTEQGHKHFVDALHGQWYSTMMANVQREMYRLETGVEYDYIVRARYDVIYHRKVQYETLDPNMMHVMSRVHSDHMHDFFAVSNHKNMNAYSSMFLNLEYFLSKPSPDWRCSEATLLACMRHYNIQCKEFGEGWVTILRPGENV